MTFEEAIRKSIRAYMKGKNPDNLFKAIGKVKYTRDYFDSLEKDILGEEDKGKGKKKAKDEEVAE
jgi:hypothetical protein